MNSKQKKAIVLTSGGLDSTTILAIAASDDYELFALTFDYGQRHRYELDAAKNICDVMAVKQQLVFPLDMRLLGGSALTDDIDVPKDRTDEEMNEKIPITYVPARNTIFLSIALGWAETLGAADIFIGVNAVDYSGYPDCRPEYIAEFIKLANLATKSGVEKTADWKIHTPLIEMSKSEIIRTGMELGVDYSLTHSCYDPLENGRSCGKCDSCLLRLKGFEEAGLVDPLDYPDRH